MQLRVAGGWAPHQHVKGSRPINYPALAFTLVCCDQNEEYYRPHKHRHADAVGWLTRLRANLLALNAVGLAMIIDVRNMADVGLEALQLLGSSAPPAPSHTPPPLCGAPGYVKGLANRQRGVR